MIVEHDVTIRHEHDEVNHIEVRCAGEWSKFTRERTCHNAEDDYIWFECSECGEYLTVEFFDGGYGTPNYCPNCGARVVEGC